MRDKFGRYKKGHPPSFTEWKGKKFSKEHIENLSKAHRKQNLQHSIRMKKLWQDPEYKKRQSKSHKKQKVIKSILTKEEQSELNSRKMKELWLNEEYRKKQKLARGEEWKRKIGKANSGKKRRPYSKELIKKMLKRRIPSSLEQKFLCIIKKNHLPYKYVGNGSFVIAGYNPDFININSQKIAIEVYSRYYKQKDGRIINKWKSKRKAKFQEYDWKLLFFNETQVKEDFVLETLKMEA